MQKPSARQLRVCFIALSAATVAWTASFVAIAQSGAPAQNGAAAPAQAAAPNAAEGQGRQGGANVDDPANATADYSPKPPVRPLSVAEEQKRFLLPPGYRLEPVLTDPDIEEPAQVAFDGNGRMFALEIRCHIVTFNLTTRDPDLLAQLARSLGDLDEARRKPDLSVPECVRDYAVADNIVHRVEPEDAGSKAASIPVRIVVAKDGSVKHVHVIRATAAQRRNIEEALRQWKLKPYMREGRALDIETGVLIRFKQTDM